ncbi:MAG TPA: phosphoribosylamine--glycine ligase [Longimicrobiales bacterium]|nr:phosphoribosylamine--glycine ligase [Longimicrobiales bacterium]
MRILVVGNGGREHALLWKLRQDAPDADLFVTRGSGGTAPLAAPIPLDPTDSGALAAWAAARNIDLTIIGPEAPLAEGIVDHFVSQGLVIFGPTRAATAIESSKSFAKALMQEANVPTASFAAFTDAEPAERYLREHGAPIVVKASGLAAGKGAVVCSTVEGAIETAHAMLQGNRFGEAGREVVIEEFMEGEELSVLALTDGEYALPLVPAQDHKRIGEGDTGPNTGGMGAYAPVSLATPELLERVQREILLPTLAALRARNRRFRGVLYAGLMLTPAGPKVVEFNARFGDPETEVVLPLLESSLLEPMLAIARGESIKDVRLATRPGAALTTVLAAAGYPGTPEKGKPVMVPAWVANAADVLVFHAGTRLENEAVVTSGGRVLAVTGLGATLADAAARSLAAADAIEFEGKHYRRDIGWRELKRLVSPAV